MLAAPALSIVPPLYARHGAMRLTDLGWAIVSMKTADALFDPLIGLALRRLAVGGRGTAIAILLACIVAAVSFMGWTHITPQSDSYQFVLWGVALSFAWSLFSVAHQAFLVIGAAAPADRARLAGWRNAASRAGLLLCLSWLSLNGTGAGAGAAVLSLERLALAGAGLIALAAALFWFGVRPHRVAPVRRPPRSAAVSGSLFRPPANRALFGLTVCKSLGDGMTGALFVIFMDNAMHATSAIPPILLSAAIVGTIMSGVAPGVLRRLADVRVVAFAELVVAMMLVLLAISPFVPSGMILVFTAFAISAVVAPCGTVAMTVIVARLSLSEESRESGADHAALMFGTIGFVQQTMIGLGAAVALLLADGALGTWIGVALMTPLQTLVASFAIVPAIVRFIGSAFALRIALSDPVELQSPS